MTQYHTIFLQAGTELQKTEEYGSVCYWATLCYWVHCGIWAPRKMIDGLPTESASYTLHDPIFYLSTIPPPQNRAILVKHQTNFIKCKQYALSLTDDQGVH